ncbi:GTP pyrophosphokinase family protein, partial [Burkholderia multivorans]
MASPTDPFTPGQAERVRRLRTDFARMLMHHQFAIDEMLTKVSILREEFLHLHRYNPIEHIS